MKIAELFVNLGIKGSESSKKSLAGVDQGLTNIKSSGLAAKAMILGVVYGLERMMSASAAQGQGLMQFSAYLGMSAEQLQRYQYAGRQVGLTNEEMMGTFNALNSAMTNIKLNKGSPEGMFTVAKGLAMAKKEALDMNKALNDREYMFKRLNEFAKIQMDRDVQNAALKSFGLSEGVIAGMRRNAFDPSIMARANIYSEKEAANLAKINAMWGNLSDKFMKQMGHLNAKHGASLVKDLSKVAEEFIRIIDLVAKLSEKWEVFDRMSRVLQNIGSMMSYLGEDKLEDEKRVRKNNYTGKMKEFYQRALDEREYGEGLGFVVNKARAFKDSIANDMAKSAAQQKAISHREAISGGNTTVNQTINYQGPGTSSQEINRTQRDAAEKYSRVSPAQAGGI